jgi:hypothetical protein
MRAKEGLCKGAKPYGFYKGEEAVLERMAALRWVSIASQNSSTRTV